VRKGRIRRMAFMFYDITARGMANPTQARLGSVPLHPKFGSSTNNHQELSTRVSCSLGRTTLNSDTLLAAVATKLPSRTYHCPIQHQDSDCYITSPTSTSSTPPSSSPDLQSKLFLPDPSSTRILSTGKAHCIDKAGL
jgi:hypothetical protein